MAQTKSTPQSQDFFTLLGDTFKLIKESWEALLLNIVTFLVIGLIPMALFAVSIIFFMGSAFSSAFNSNLGVGISLTFAILLLIVALVISVLLMPSIFITQLASVRGKKIEIKDAFKQGLPKILPMLGLAILSGLAVIVGLIFLIIPGLIIGFFLSMSMYILIDKNTGVIESMKQSYELIKVNWMPVLALFIVNLAISIVSNFPAIGGIANLVLSVAYFCLPAIIYIRIAKK